METERMIPRPIPREQGVAVSKDGCRITWYRYGSGDRVVLFVPTWNLVDARVVGHQVEYLAERFTVITYDPRGAGASDRPRQGYDFPLHAADALAVLDANGIRHAAWVTASRSVNSAVIIATEHADRVERLAVVAPFLRLAPAGNRDFWTPREAYEGWDRFNAHAWRADWPGFARFFMSEVFVEPDSATTIDQLVSIALEATPEILITQERELDWGMTPPLLPKVTCPTLFIHGDSDATLPIANVKAIAELVPNAQLKLMPGGGHRPDIRTPQRVNAVLSEFLDG